MAGSSSSHEAIFRANTDQTQRELRRMQQAAMRSFERIERSVNRASTSLERNARSAQRTASANQRLAQSQERVSRASMGMVQHTDRSYRALNRLGSSAAGVMLGMAALERSVMGVAFGLIFLRYSIVPIVAAAAAATIALVGLAMAMKSLFTQSLRAGRALEDMGQRLASFYRSADLAQKIMTQADEISRQFGTNRDDVIGMLDALEKVGLRSDAYIKAILNTAAATGQAQAEVSERFTQLLRAGASERAGLMDQFVRDFDLPARQYASTLELAEAMNERFKGSAEAAANTATGLLNRLKASWTSIMTSLGAITLEVFRAIVQPILAFVEGMIRGFNEAKKAADATGDLRREVEGLREITRKLLPMMAALGTAIGRILFRAAMLAVRAIKALYSAILTLSRFIKELRGNLPGTTQMLKEFFDPFVVNGWRVGAAAAFLKTFFDEIIRASGIRLPRFNLATMITGSVDNIRGRFNFSSLFDDVLRALNNFDLRGALARAFSIGKGGFNVGEEIAVALRRGFYSGGVRGAIDEVTLVFGRWLADALTSRGYGDMVARHFAAMWDSAVRMPPGMDDLIDRQVSGLMDNIIRALQTPEFTFTGRVGRFDVFGLIREAMERGFGPAIASVQRMASQFIDNIASAFRGAPVALRGLGGSIGAALRFEMGLIARGASTPFNVFTDLVDNFGRGLIMAFRTGIPTLFAGTLRIGDMIWEGIRGSIRAVAATPAALFSGLIAAIREGLILAVLELAAHFVVDLLPLSDKLAESLHSSLSLGFLAAGVLFLAGGPFALLAGAVVAGIFVGLDQVFPGTSTRVKEWIDELFTDAISGTINFFRDEFVPTLEKLSDWIQTTGVPKARAFADEVNGYLRPKLEAIASFMKGDFMTAVTGVSGWIINTGIPKVIEFADYLRDNWGAEIKDLAQTIIDFHEETLKAFWRFLKDDLWPEIREFKDEVWPAMEPVLNDWKTIITEIAEYFIEHVVPNLITFMDFILENVVPPIRDILLVVLGDVLAILLDIATELIVGFFNAWTTAKDLLKDPIIPTIKTTWETLEDVWDWIIKVKDELNGSFTTAWNAIKTPLGEVDTFLGNIVALLMWIKNNVISPTINWPEPPGWVKDILAGKLPGVPGGGSLPLPSIPTPSFGWPGGGVPGVDLNPFHTGGVVPGPIGAPRMITALGGERLLGSPTASHNRASEQVTNIYITIPLSDSVVVTEKGVDMLAEQVARRTMRGLGTSRKFSIHRS